MLSRERYYRSDFDLMVQHSFPYVLQGVTVIFQTSQSDVGMKVCSESSLDCDIGWMDLQCFSTRG